MNAASTWRNSSQSYTPRNPIHRTGAPSLRSPRANAHPPGADRRARGTPAADRAPPDRAGRGDPRLTPLQGQHSRAPFIALAARLDGFTRADLEAAIAARAVVKTTIMRLTLHVAAAADYPAYAQLARQARLRNWRATYPQLDAQEVTAELRAWLAEPRTNDEIRARVRAYDGVTAEPWTAVIFARTLLPLVQLPPAGFWDDKRRRASSSTRARCRSPRTPRRSCSRATSRRSGPRAAATSPPGRASRSATSRPRGSGWRPSRTATSRAPSCSTCPAGRCRRRRRGCRCGSSRAGSSRCSPTPTASGSSRPSCSRSG